MFALLEHDTTPSGPADARPADASALAAQDAPRGGPSGLHWDLLIEAPGHERLPTWRLGKNPTGDARETPISGLGESPIIGIGEIPAERVADHRPLYLDYEGEISGGRGVVRRIDRGEAIVRRLGGDEARFELRGDRLRGEFEIVRTSAGQLIFRRAR